MVMVQMNGNFFCLNVSTISEENNLAGCSPHYASRLWSASNYLQGFNFMAINKEIDVNERNVIIQSLFITDN